MILIYVRGFWSLSIKALENVVKRRDSKVRYPPAEGRGLCFRIGSRSNAAVHDDFNPPSPNSLAQCLPREKPEWCSPGTSVTHFLVRTVILQVVWLFTSRWLPRGGDSFSCAWWLTCLASRPFFSTEGARLGIMSNFCCSPGQSRGNFPCWLGPFNPWGREDFWARHGSAGRYGRTPMVLYGAFMGVAGGAAKGRRGIVDSEGKGCGCRPQIVGKR